MLRRGAVCRSGAESSSCSTGRCRAISPDAILLSLRRLEAATGGGRRTKRDVGGHGCNALIVVPGFLAFGRGLHAIDTDVIGNTAIRLDASFMAEAIGRQLSHLLVDDQSIIAFGLAGRLEVMEHAGVDAGLLAGRHATVHGKEAPGE